MDDLIKRFDEACQDISLGHIILNRSQLRNKKSKASLLIASGNAKIRQIKSEFGRIRKKEKFLKKNYIVVVLTECFGVQMKILKRK